MRTLTSGFHGVVDAMNKFMGTAEALWTKGMAWPLAFLGGLLQGTSSFTMYRLPLGDYLLQITKKKDGADY